MNIKRIFLIVLLFSTYCYCSSHNIIGNNYNEKSNLTITNVYVVGLVLEWYPINDMNGKQGFIFLNTFLSFYKCSEFILDVQIYFCFLFFLRRK